MIGFNRWLRRFVRKYTNPIPGDKAELWKRRLSLGYLLLSWNAFGIVCYYVMTGREDWALFYGLKSEEEASVRPGIYFANLLGLEKATIVRVHGFTKVDELDYTSDTYVPPQKENETPVITNSETNSEQ